jgi:hypothetical protein
MITGILSILAVTAHVGSLALLIHDEHMNGWWKCLVLNV